jgi:hypothetical protein
MSETFELGLVESWAFCSFGTAGSLRGTEKEVSDARLH